MHIMPNWPRKLNCFLGLTLAVLSATGRCETVLQIDASAPVPTTQTGYFHMGTATAPNGASIGIDSRTLLRDGHPWLPVMGEFHFSRVPAQNWATELHKMKAAGVDIVSTYIIWNHHEAQQGRFDWQGNRDLHRFVQLCKEAGLDVVLRIGPWAHAEARYGGIPDWVVDAMPTRRDDTQYLHYVERLYDEIGRQVQGQLWKQGGNIIGIQLENEFNLSGPGQGADHIRHLKALALQAGLDAPLYTVTGWDGTVYPSGEVTPVFGSYPDEPWATSVAELPPKESYAFRFDSRVSGDLGAQTAATAPGTAETDAAHTPFLGAEYGAGLPAMYRRRTVVTPDDIAAMVPVQLGSGVNLLGYYMFHGGRNPVGEMSLEESTLSGGYNDTPKVSYDFQAPLGPDGQQRPVQAYLRPFHYFLHDFGAQLAPMTVRKPEHVPTGPGDLEALRWSVRSQGDSGFLFVNNHVRQYPLARHEQLRFSVKLVTQTLKFPNQAIDVVDGDYFIWPLNFDLGGTKLTYATAQPVAKLDDGSNGVTYVFAASGAIPVELGFDAKVLPYLKAPSARIMQADGRVVVDHIQPGTSAALTITPPQARPVTLLVLTTEQARQLSIGEFSGKRRLVLSGQQAWFEHGKLQLRSLGDNRFRVAIYPALGKSVKLSVPIKRQGQDGLFQVFEAELPLRHLDVSATVLRTAQAAPPVVRGGLANAALQPAPESFRAAAAWQIAVPDLRESMHELDDAILQIDFVGDIGRLFSGTHMLDDWYYNGMQWEIGLRQLALEPGTPLTLTVMPLRADAPIYIDRKFRPDFAGKAQMAELRGVRLVPVYRLLIGS